MATFRHKYAALTLQDDKGVWAQFEPQSEITSEGREVKYGVLDTDDAALVKRLRALIGDGKGKDPDLTEIKAAETKTAETKTDEKQ